MCRSRWEGRALLVPLRWLPAAVMPHAAAPGGAGEGLPVGQARACLTRATLPHAVRLASAQLADEADAAAKAALEAEDMDD